MALRTAFSDLGKTTGGLGNPVWLSLPLQVDPDRSLGSFNTTALIPITSAMSAALVEKLSTPSDNGLTPDNLSSSSGTVRNPPTCGFCGLSLCRSDGESGMGDEICN
ncbi:hypothetical protein KUCAC02_016770 [Chaenocephalus aceratus]|nr:hypothetical protein KUCAC02_016770 [Chaenocephalus aceratus]